MAAYEGGRAAEHRVMRLGLRNFRYLAHIHPELVKLAIEMVRLGCVCVRPQVSTKLCR